MKTHIMLDIETLGTSVGSVVASVGMAAFNEEKIIDCFHVRMSVEQSQSAYGLTVDASTVLWWLNQRKEAQGELKGDMFPNVAIDAVICFLLRHSPERIWGNGPGFDNALLREVIKRVGFQTKDVMDHRKDSCYRTVNACYGEHLTGGDFGPSHVAINDAKSQAQKLITMCKVNSLCFLK